MREFDKQITIVIPTYNRAHLIERTLCSLERQTNKDFICIIVDDGSTDKTRDVIDNYAERSSLSIEYYYKENGGVISARLFGLRKVKTALVICLDSDDELTRDAIDVLLSTWNGLTKEQKKKYYGISTPVYNYQTRSVYYGYFPPGVNRSSRVYFNDWIKAGERFDLRRTNICLRQYEEYDKILKKASSSFVPEGVLHLKYELMFPFFCINHICRVYHCENEDSIMHIPLDKEKCRVSYFSHTYIVNHYLPNKKLSFMFRFRESVWVVKFGLLLGYSPCKIITDIRSKGNKVIVIASLPFGVANYLLGEKRADVGKKK